MADLTLTRIEGGIVLRQAADGRVQLSGGAHRGFEQRLRGRAPLDAVFLTQRICADGCVAHALAAVHAWERAAELYVAENGRLLREFMHAISLAHAHLRQFYEVALPDYLPWTSLRDYAGSAPSLREMRDGIADRPEGHWTRHSFEHPFSKEEAAGLWESRMEAQRLLGVLQRVLATLGGKYPVVMSIVPGGVNVRLSEAMLIKLRGYLAEVRRFLAEQCLRDGLLVLRRYPSLKALGRGVPDFICTGSGEDDAALEGALFPSGVLLADRLEPFAAVATESLHSAYYRVPASGGAGTSAGVGGAYGAVTEPDPAKTGAYSWIKAPRYQGRPMEAGPFARLVMAYLSGARMTRPEFVEELERLLDGPLRQGNTVAGRMLARLAEPAALLERAETLLEQVDPAHAAVAADNPATPGGGEGLGLVEAPGGSLQHRMILAKGRIVHYDIVTPSTWNGAPADEEGAAGSIETALNRTPPDLATPLGQRAAARIVHSFAFSSTDAIH